jgi:hypothetical protein
VSVFAYHNNVEDLLWLPVALLYHLQDRKNFCLGCADVTLQQLQNGSYVLSY